MNNRIIIRADGNATIGLGHVFRVLSLADMLDNKYHCTLVIAAPSDFIKQQAALINVDVVSIPEIEYQTPDMHVKGSEVPFDMDNILTGDELVITDGYWFGTEYQTAIKAKGCKLVCIDDLIEVYFVADAIINHAPGLNPTFYQTEPYTQKWLGLEYLLLRKPFFKPVPLKDTSSPVLLISMGGADHTGLTLKFLQFINKIDISLTINVLVGAAIQPTFAQQLKDFASVNDHIKLFYNLDAAGVASLMDECTHTLLASSNVMLEAYARGIKSMTGYSANNQMNLYNGMLKEGHIVGLGNLNEIEFDAFINIFTKYIGSTDNSITGKPKHKLQEKIEALLS